jgi:hypothetical protein
MTAAGAGFSQPGSGTDITVTEEFEWTRGTLNSSNYLATLTLDGATATITPLTTGGIMTPPTAGTVYLGSNITLENGAVATMGEGTIELTNDGIEIDVEANCAFDVNPGTSAVAEISNLLSTHIQISANAAITVLSGTFQAAGRLTNAGSFTLMLNTGAAFPGVVGNDVAYLQTGGQTLLSNGSTLHTDASKDVKITGGTLGTMSSTSDATTTATISSNLEVTGGNILIGVGTVPHTFGTLQVSGNVVWTGGTYRPVVFGTQDNGSADLWLATGTFTIGAGATIAPGCVDDEGLEMTPVEANLRWLILQGNGGITGNPTFDANWAFLDPVMNPGQPVTQWKIKSVVN